MPVFGNLFIDEPIPINGKLQVSVLDKPGFGLTVNPKAPLIDAAGILNPSPERPLKIVPDVPKSSVLVVASPAPVPDATTVSPTEPQSSQLKLLSGKTVAITGGATGIGRAIAIKMAQHGANVAINYLGPVQDDDVSSLAAEIEAISQLRESEGADDGPNVREDLPGGKYC